MTALKFADAEETRLVGLLAPYGGPHNGRDVAGEYFSAKTDFCLDWYDGPRPALYHHGLDPDTGTQKIGNIESLKATDAGLWMEAQLDKNAQYYGQITELVKAGKLGLSSGAMSHLVQVAKSGEILRWPLVEGSLTPTPCNIMARVDLETAKSHYKSAGLDVDALQTLWQQAGSAESKAAPPDDTDQAPYGASYEALFDNLRSALNPITPWSVGGYTTLLETHADHAKVARIDPDADEPTYWSIPYSHKDGAVTLGTAAQIDEPAPLKTVLAESPLALDAISLSRHAAALTTRTKDLGERRVKAGRQLSTANRNALEAAAKQCDEVAKAIRDLLATTDQMMQDQAKAAYLESPEALALEIELLELIAV